MNNSEDEHENENPFMLPGGIRIIREEEDMNINTRIDVLLADQENRESLISHTLEDIYKSNSNEELKCAYLDILNGINKSNQFGSSEKDDSISNFKIILKEVVNRKLNLSGDERNLHFSVIKLMYTIMIASKKKTAISYLIIAIICLSVVIGSFSSNMIYVNSIFISVSLASLYFGLRDWFELTHLSSMKKKIYKGYNLD